MTTTTNVSADQLRELVGPRDTIYTLTTYTRSQTDYVRVFVVKNGDILEATYALAQVLGRKFKPGQGIAYRGGGYSKGLEAADDVSRAAFGKPLDQSMWREL